MSVKHWKTDKPKPYDKNPRKISGLAVEKVASSIENFGFNQPIVVDQNGVIIVGHTRLEAAKRLNLEKVPVVVREISEEDAKAYRIADNRVGEETVWLNNGLAYELRMPDELVVELALTGFDDDELAKPLGEEEEDIDDGPEPNLDNLADYSLLIEYDAEAELQAAYDDAKSRGLTCKIIS